MNKDNHIELIKQGLASQFKEMEEVGISGIFEQNYFGSPKKESGPADDVLKTNKESNQNIDGVCSPGVKDEKVLPDLSYQLKTAVFNDGDSLSDEEFNEEFKAIFSESQADSEVDNLEAKFLKFLNMENMGEEIDQSTVAEESEIDAMPEDETTGEDETFGGAAGEPTEEFGEAAPIEAQINEELSSFIDSEIEEGVLDGEITEKDITDSVSKQHDVVEEDINQEFIDANVAALEKFINQVEDDEMLDEEMPEDDMGEEMPEDDMGEEIPEDDMGEEMPGEGEPVEAEMGGADERLDDLEERVGEVEEKVSDGMDEEVGAEELDDVPGVGEMPDEEPMGEEPMGEEPIEGMPEEEEEEVVEDMPEDLIDLSFLDGLDI